jgi:putative lipase involved disintegration of autophagic bodies
MGPDVESREALLELAKMTNNAYVEPQDPYWYDLRGNWSEVRVYSYSAQIFGLAVLNILVYVFYLYVACNLISLLPGLPIRLGTRCGRFPWLCLCNT